MKRKKIFTLVFMGFVFTLFSQISYNFTTSVGSWNALPGGATTVFNNGVDDQISPPIAIGFKFPFGCQLYDTMQISSNGFVYLTNTSNTISTSMPSNDLAGTSNRPIIAPLWDDLRTSRLVVKCLIVEQALPVIEF